MKKQYEMHESVAEEMYKILVQHAGFRDTPQNRDLFIFHMTTGTSEYRFMGSLGFGGKFFPREKRVTCYSEDESPERLAIIERTNKAIADFYDHVDFS